MIRQNCNNTCSSLVIYLAKIRRLIYQFQSCWSVCLEPFPWLSQSQRQHTWCRQVSLSL